MLAVRKKQHPHASVTAGPGNTDRGAESDLYQIAFQYGFAPDFIKAGTGYFRRLAAQGFQIDTEPSYPQPTDDSDLTPGRLPDAKQLVAVTFTGLAWQAWFELVHLTCIYVSTKFLHDIGTAKVLATIVEDICDFTVEEDYVRELEFDCLKALKWRLRDDENDDDHGDMV